MIELLLSLSLLLFSGLSYSQDDLELLDEKDIELLREDVTTPKKIDLSAREESDDLEALKEDVGEIFFEGDKKGNQAKDILKEIEFEEFEKEKEDKKIKKAQGKKQKIEVQEFDAGKEEKELMKIAKSLGSKIPDSEWNDIAKDSLSETYKISCGDTLWQISKTLFGTGFYYSKVWSLNPYIKNPHQIEPGMMLAFSTGSESDAPHIKLGSFSQGDDAAQGVQSIGDLEYNLSDFAEDSVPGWFQERKRLQNQGVFIQNASDYNYKDLKNISSLSLEKEYENYIPPETKLNVVIPNAYDDVGFDKSSIVQRRIREGFHIQTFVTSNIVQDLGYIEAAQKDGTLLTDYNTIYVRFDPALAISPGDKFSVYSAEGRVEHPISERSGYRYTITGSIRVVRKKNDLWVCEILSTQGTIRRNDRVTVYTPKIDKILKTFNQQNIEAAIIGADNNGRTIFSFGDVVYLDRGRADGLEVGNILEAYSFTDRNTNERITLDPTYKVGEITVITLSENFATGLISNSTNDIQLGQLAITKTAEQALRESRNRYAGGQDAAQTKRSTLEELDVELNLNADSQRLLEEADQIELTEDELDELERQERERSILKDHEKDLKELDRLEKDIEQSEGLLNEIVEDEDKLLMQQDLDKIEKNLERPNPDAFESLDEIEKEIGKKYLDEDLNSRDNPYGLTEFDLEEIDELLNTNEN